MSGDYRSMMKRPTDKAIFNELEKLGKSEKQSEFKKPYLFPEEGYSEMEHWYPSPHMSLFDPTRPTPGFSGPIPAGAEDGWVGWYIVGCSLTCTPSIIRNCDDGVEFCCALNPAWQPVESVSIEGPATLTKKSYAGQGTGTEICFTLDSDAKDGDKITINVKTKPKSGQSKSGFCSGSFRVACDKCDCAVEANVAYDTTNSDDTIDRDGTAALVITGGCLPYDWSVSGTGFTLDNAQTAGLTNTLNADATACGSATITVTDNCGTVATGYVRCTAEGSLWVLKETCGILAGRYGEKISGKTRRQEWWCAACPDEECWGETGQCTDVEDCEGIAVSEGWTLTKKEACPDVANIYCVCRGWSIKEWECPT